MYLQYCLIAISTIFVISFSIFYFMKKNNQANRKNTINLLLCTVFTAACAMLTPPIAKFFAKELSFSLPVSIIVTAILFICLVGVAFYLLQPMVSKLFGDKPSEDTQDNAIEDTPAIEAVPEVGADTQQDYGATNLIISQEIIEEISLQTTEELMEPTYENITYPIESGLQEYNSDDQEDILTILDKAIDCKNTNNYQGAIKAYEAALVLKPEDELCFLIILDLCSLYKKTNQKETAYNLLDSSPCMLLDYDKKADIIRNINI